MQCPFCKHHFTPTGYDVDVIHTGNLHSDYTKFQKNGKLTCIVCPNVECKKTIVFLELTYNNGREFLNKMIYPDKLPIRQYPDYIPQQILEDYEEACNIVNISPKASATLARRCLQGIIRDFYQVKGKNLHNEIESIRDKVDTQLFDTINAVRQLGNIGAHMENDVNTIVDIDPEEARQLIGLIELLFEETYIRRHDREQRLLAIQQINKDKQDLRKKLPDGESS